LLKGILAGLVAALVLGLGLAATRHSTLDAASYTPDQWKAWSYACTLSAYSCRGVEPPPIVTTKYLEKSSVLGLHFRQSDTVYVTTGLDRGMYIAVLAHEMTHYLQMHVAHLVVDNGLANCLAEYEAFEVSDKVLTDLGLASKRRNGDLKKGYGC